MSEAGVENVLPFDLPVLSSPWLHPWLNAFRRRALPAIPLILVNSVVCLAVDVGSGSPNQAIQDRFVNAYFRNNFQNTVSLPPLGDVKKLGSTGLVQEFQDSKKTVGSKFALVIPNTNAADVFQILGSIYPQYSTVGVAVAGYPVADQSGCPAVNGVTCVYQLFSMNYAIFAFGGTTVGLGGTYYTKWSALNGLNGVLGVPLDTPIAATSSFKTTAMVQTFMGGAIFNITSGQQNAQTFAIAKPVFDLYSGYGGFMGTLGFPLSDETVSSAGLHRQTFESGRLEFNTGSPPVLLVPVNEVQLTPSGPLQMHSGDVVQVAANTFTGTGAQVSGRAVSFTTSNSRVVTIQPSGSVVTLRAVGAGTATITAFSEGKVSVPLTVTVTGQCCAVGEGAPSAAISQVFQDAVTRNRLSVSLPSANPVQRLGSGYVQDVVAAQAPTVHYLILKSDRASIAYVITGDLLTAYLAAGGPAGSLGYAVSDAGAGGTQRFENGAALAGSPVFVVAEPVLTKWAALGYEPGLAGPPTGNAAPFSSLSAYNGVAQPFAKGVIFAIASGNRAGQAYLVSGPILVRYGALGGPNGSFGVPISDEFSISGMRRQNFEDGYLDYTPGDAVAVEHAAERQPAVSTNPGTVAPGTRLRLSVTGFPNGGTLRVSVTGQPDFVVSTPNGSYDWDVYVPAAARSGVVQVHARDVNSMAVADGSYTIKTLAELHPQLVKMQGDGQSGPPGATLVQPLRVALRDSSGNSIAGVAVSFQASGGGQITPVSAVTDANGQATASYRLPLSAGISAATARAGGQIATFDFRSSATSISNFPQFTSAIDSPLGAGQASIAQKGGLLTAVAAILRFYQNRGEFAAAHGLSDPSALNQFLQTLSDGFLSNPATGEQVVNLWRTIDFIGGGVDVSVEDPDPAHLRDLVAAGSPVLLSLLLTVDGKPAGGGALVATGIGDDGRILIQDPNPAFARASLADYLAGFPVAFSGGARTWKGTLVSAVRFLARAPSGTGFLLTALSQSADAIKSLDISSVIGHCGLPLDLPDAAVSGMEPPAAVAVSRFIPCDGTQPMYQVSAGSVPASLTALRPGGSTQNLAGSAAGVYKVTLAGTGIAIGPQDVSFSSASVVNAATFANGLAPGGLFSIFGAGFASPGGVSGANPVVKIGGFNAQVIVASPFQINAQVPPDLAPGIYPLQVESALGVSGQPVEVRSVAPGIFVLGSSTEGQPLGAVVNQDGTVNGPAAPARRGDAITIYCTGLGAVTRQGNLSFTTANVSAVLGGLELPSSFSGLTPGFIGLYQVNVPVPVTAPPGLGQPLLLRALLREGKVDSNTVFAAIQ